MLVRWKDHARLMSKILPAYSLHTTFFSLARPSASLTRNLKASYGNYRNFKRTWRAQEQNITSWIKKTTTSQQLLEVIKRKGHMMNIINLTAVLDRMEQQQMIGTAQITTFVVRQLKKFKSVFRKSTFSETRAISNIVCYLGNIKNLELNQLISQVDFRKLLTHSKSIEKSMLVTGIIRLGLFDKVFNIDESKLQDKQILFDSVLLEDLGLNELLSIWLALFTENKLKDDHLSKMILEAIESESKNADDKLTLKTYTYALMCYTQTYQPSKLRDLHQLVRFNVPQNSNQSLMAHQLSLLLQAISKLRLIQSKQKQTNKKYPSIYFSSKFKQLLELNFCSLCKHKNITLRNIANVYKGLSEHCQIAQATLKIMVSSMKRVLQEELKYIHELEQEKYTFENKVDKLSLTSLFWKLNQVIYKRRLSIEETQQAAERVQLYTMRLNQFGLVNKLDKKELMMLYSGFYFIVKHQKYNLSPQFAKLSRQLVIKKGDSCNLKEVTLFFTYFKQTSILNNEFCKFVYEQLSSIKLEQVQKNPTALKLIQKKTCPLNAKEQCLHCYNLHSH